MKEIKQQTYKRLLKARLYGIYVIQLGIIDNMVMQSHYQFML